ncbi:MAG: RecX family transcriptional regulator [Bacteroidetes bacterium]|nr:RecX family transcriptional regulator [Bacteroidota bacterium]
MDDVEKHKKKYSPEIAWLKIARWCAYQERSQQEVRDKLYEYGLFSKDVEVLISRLIGDNFLNEERFAIAFAGGKFRQLGWGKVKIKAALKLKKVFDYCLRKGIASIPDQDYILMLEKVVAKRAREEKENNPMKRMHKLAQYAISRGYESDLVWEVLRSE